MTTYSHELFGYRLEGLDYREMAPDAQGRLHSAVTGLYLAVRNNWLRWLTQEGRVLLTSKERAEQRVERLAAKLRALGIAVEDDDE